MTSREYMLQPNIKLNIIKINKEAIIKTNHLFHLITTSQYLFPDSSLSQDGNFI